MKDNVIKFPGRNDETKVIISDMDLEEAGNDFAYEVMEQIHDILHEKNGECIFTDEQYLPLVTCLGEVLTALYMFSEGNDTHPFHEIAQDIFGDDSLDISEEEGYNRENLNNEGPKNADTD